MEIKTKTSPKVKHKKYKRASSDARLGYLMIAPSLLIIFVIALYPVARSLYLSLFDLRLNHPTKNDTHLSYQFDLERYLKNYDLVKGNLKRAANDSDGEAKDKLLNAITDLDDLNKIIFSQSDIASKEKSVRSYVDNFKPIDNDKIRLAKIDKTTALNALDKYNSLLKALPAISVGEDAKASLQKGTGLMEEIRDSIISPNFIGFDNYKYFAKEGRFWEATDYTLKFTIISVFIELILGLMVALIINRNFKGRGIVRASVLIPWAIPTVVSALMWKFIYDGQFGIISYILAKLHIISNPGVLLTSNFGAKFSVVFADVWKTTPYMALLLLAGLQTIDSTLYEAGDVDGASKIQQFFRITLPLLKPTILVALLFRTLDAFRIFDLVYVLTGGGNSTETITSLAYKNMFAQMDFGKGSTLSVIIFICIALISIGYIKILGAEVMAAEN
jgi:multiple sugar transport system permease protein